MDNVIRIAAFVAATTAVPHAHSYATIELRPPPAAAAWPGEDRFRHAAMSWTTTVFAYAAARSAQQDRNTALAIALPVTAAIGVGKEIIDHRRGGVFSAGDIVADAAGAGIAWLILCGVR